MKVGIVGLGLIGASFAKTLHSKRAAEVYGVDISDAVLKRALENGVVDGELTEKTAKDLNMLVVALYPRAFRDAAERFAPYLPSGAVVTDFCGIKRAVLQDMQEFRVKYPNLYFVGAHPMAGREYSGFDHAVTTLFERASMILVPCSDNADKLREVQEFFLSLGFGETVVCDADYHDTEIAYTSQLCHVVSNAFIKNKSAALHDGFSAGSYRDLTRVARMNSRMWAELMTDNRDKLSSELSELISHLSEYLHALEQGDEEQLYELLEEGNRRKLQIDTKRK